MYIIDWCTRFSYQNRKVVGSNFENDWQREAFEWKIKVAFQLFWKFLQDEDVLSSDKKRNGNEITWWGGKSHPAADTIYSISVFETDSEFIVHLL